MVYCSKCGMLNFDETTVCSKCGEPLRMSYHNTGQYWRSRHFRDQKEYGHRHNGNAGMGAFIFGVIIIVVGLSIMFPDVITTNLWWPIVLIIIGSWLLFIGLRRSRKYTQNPQE